jgi:hypothetical protein
MMISGLILMSGLMGCDRDAKDLVPVPSKKHPGVVEVGELGVVTVEEFNILNDVDDDNPIPEVREQHCTEREDGTLRCFYGQLGQTKLGQKGGATFTFTGNGEEVCLVVDPETVFWAQSMAPGASRVAEYAYPDYYNDDGDLDMFSGLSSYYTGSPGVELGDFKGFYTDSLGQQVEIEYGECFQTGAQTGMNDAHAGRATVEYCGIDTDQREGIQYTVMLETVSVPLDDGIMSFGAVVLEGRCTRLGPSECTIRGESLDSIATKPNGETCKTPGENDCEYRQRFCTEELEDAQCDKQLGPFCCANPQMCGEEYAPDDACEDGVYDIDGIGHTRDEWCDATGLCCPDDSSDGDTGD